MERDNLSDEIRNTFNKLRFLLSVDSVIEDVDLNICNHFLNENKKIYNRLKRHEINLLSERGLTIPDILLLRVKRKCSPIIWNGFIIPIHASLFLHYQMKI